MAKDPVCGMEVDEKTAAGKSEYKGQTYYFCAPGCKRAFEKGQSIAYLPIQNEALYWLARQEERKGEYDKSIKHAEKLVAGASNALGT